MSTDRRLTDRAKDLRSAQTDAEQRLWYRLRAGRLLGHKFKRQKPIGLYIVDFVCMEAHVIAELDGGQHVERATYDEARTAFLESEGFKVLRFWNDEALTRTDEVLEQIRLAIEERAQALSLGPSPAGGRGKTRQARSLQTSREGSPLPPAGEGLGKRARQRRTPAP